jgi:hypothetical protein
LDFLDINLTSHNCSRQCFLHPFFWQPSAFQLVKSANNRKYNLVKPIVTLISKIDNEFKIEYPPLELYAFNDDINEAKDEFLDDFFDLCDNILFMNDSDLGKYPKLWKSVLLTLVRKNE